MSKVVAVIQGRMASHRLPGKLLAAIDEVPLLDRLVHRTGAARVDEWWLATTSQPEDDEAAAAAQRLGLAVFRGSPADVLSRFAEVARRTAADLIVRLTADNPFTNANVIDLLLADAALLDATAVLGAYRSGPPLPLRFCPEIIKIWQEIEPGRLDAKERDAPTLDVGERLTEPEVILRQHERIARVHAWREIRVAAGASEIQARPGDHA